jgi:hypothetical protein
MVEVAVVFLFVAAMMFILEFGWTFIDALINQFKKGNE